MVDPISAVSGGIAVAQGAFQFLGYIRGIRNSDVISALFRWDGEKVEGSEKFEITKRSQQENDDIWWYSVTEEPEYTFVRIPVVGTSAHEVMGQISGESNPDARYWRWVAPVLPGRIAGGEAPNLKVDFIVVGCRPKALLEHFSSR